MTKRIPRLYQFCHLFFAQVNSLAEYPLYAHTELVKMENMYQPAFFIAIL